MERETFTIDASGKVLGRVATEIAMHLIGKHKPSFQSHIDAGDNVVVDNIDKIVVTGKKLEQKKYFRHSGFPGGIKHKGMGELMDEQPAEVLKLAVSRMLPKNKHRVPRLKRLTIR